MDGQTLIVIVPLSAGRLAPARGGPLCRGDKIIRAAVAVIPLFGLVLAGAGSSAATGEAVPRAVTVARTTAIPDCTSFVDAAADDGDGTAQKPHKTIAAAVAAAPAGADHLRRRRDLSENADARRKIFHPRRRLPARQGFHGARLRALHHQGAWVMRRIVHPHRGSRPHRQPADRDRRLRDQRLFAGDLSRLLVSQRFDITNNHIHDNVCR